MLSSVYAAAWTGNTKLLPGCPFGQQMLKEIFKALPPLKFLKDVKDISQYLHAYHKQTRRANLVGLRPFPGLHRHRDRSLQDQEFTKRHTSIRPCERKSKAREPIRIPLPYAFFSNHRPLSRHLPRPPPRHSRTRPAHLFLHLSPEHRRRLRQRHLYGRRPLPIVPLRARVAELEEQRALEHEAYLGM
jgi:hypothetical protein